MTVKKLKEILKNIPDDTVVVKPYPTEAPFAGFSGKWRVTEGWQDGPYIDDAPMDSPRTKKIRMLILE